MNRHVFIMWYVTEKNGSILVGEKSVDTITNVIICIIGINIISIVSCCCSVIF